MEHVVIFGIRKLALATVAGTFLSATATPAATLLPTGQHITRTAAREALFQTLKVDLPDLPSHEVGQASAVALSPDGGTLLILTTGFNRLFGADGKPIPNQSNEYVFVFDVSGKTPVQRQVLTIANTLQGIAWAPDGKRFYVAGGVDDAVVEFVGASGSFLPPGGGLSSVIRQGSAWR